MRTLEVRLDWGDSQVVVGRLAEQQRRVYFEYGGAFVAAPLPLSPFKLPVRSGLFEHTERDFADVFGVFNDSLPDGWGLLLMDREFSKRGLDRGSLSALDRLAYIGTRGMGALTYHPPAEPADAEPLWIPTWTRRRAKPGGSWRAASRRCCRRCASRAAHPAAPVQKCSSESTATDT